MDLFYWRTSFKDIINNVELIDKNLKNQFEIIGNIDKDFQKKLMKKLSYSIYNNYCPKIIKNNILLINSNIQSKWGLVKDNKKIIEVLIENI